LAETLMVDWAGPPTSSTAHPTSLPNTILKNNDGRRGCGIEAHKGFPNPKSKIQNPKWYNH
jgi:hypothetical protein